MESFNFDKIIERRGTNAFKWASQVYFLVISFILTLLGASKSPRRQRVFAYVNIQRISNISQVHYAPKIDHDTIPMWVADMDFEAPQCIVEAMKKRFVRKIY
jgi:bifunctional pyridoxal-dependent enzyme with beta-cystathionase and maltose regulon repressor activities